MREIKFRAWDGKSIHYTSSHLNLWLKNDEFNIMQYTGLKDKNGKDIYESDKVKFYYKGEYAICIIVWNEAGYWSLKWEDGYINNFKLNASTYEVIGNIHENK